MTHSDRREFLKFAGGATATGMAIAAMPAAIQRALAMPARQVTGSIKDVQHVVILMQENRSFDHYFGKLRGVRGFGDPRPVQHDDGRTIWHQSNCGKDVLPFHPDADDLGMQFLEGLPHEIGRAHV